MKTSSNAIEVMHYFERCRLTAYPDPASPRARAAAAGRPDQSLSGAPWTIGWGQTGIDVVEGMTISQVIADRWFEEHLLHEVEPMIFANVRVSLTTGEYDGLSSALYNIGPGAKGQKDGLIVLSNGQPSTFLRRLNAGDHDGACDALGAWNRAQGLVMLGLRRRRAAEQALWRGRTGAEAIRIGKAVF